MKFQMRTPQNIVGEFTASSLQEFDTLANAIMKITALDEQYTYFTVYYNERRVWTYVVLKAKHCGFRVVSNMAGNASHLLLALGD